MKKISDFIVDKRYIILTIFIILAGISLVVSRNVVINHDISAYLPSDSETRIGMNIMESEFPETDESSLNVMFEGLDSSEVYKIKERLESIDGVSSVEYDDTSDYNNGNYTLYVINVDEAEDSKTASNVYDSVLNNFKKYTIYTSGSISDRNKTVLHLWIVAFAIVCAMIILIIMCESYVEPFLFLFTIGLAVFMNKGTNIIFDNVSYITDAIAAILQLALSMDYSIMLMNRYRQERRNTSDKCVAMKKALLNAFSSISSSSVTTIVGLLALVFMSFTIGRDLGFVLAKGVLLSLISIFLCLPALILLFDKLIIKTTKKSLNFKLNGLGRLSYKFRYPALILFILLFGISFLLKDGVNILYTGSQNDTVSKYFTENNQMAIIYNNKYEDLVSDYCKSLDDDNITSVLCYGNTINEELTYDEVNDKLDELGMDTSIDEYLLKIIYYNYYNENNNSKLTYTEFVKFIENNVYNNKDLSSKIDDDTKDNITLLENFTIASNINKKRSSKDIANILNIDESTVDQLLVLYNASNVNNKIKLADFIKFLNNDVLTNSYYSSSIDSNTQKQIKLLANFVDENTINKSMNSSELSKLFSLDESSVNSLLLLYYTNNDTNEKLTIKDFVNGVVYLKNNTNYLDNYNVDNIISLEYLANNTNNINNTKLDKANLKNIFNNIAPNLVDTVYYGAQLPDTYTFTPIEFIDFTLNNFSSYLSDTDKSNLSLVQFVMNESIKGNTYTSTELAEYLNQDKNNITSIYALILSKNNYEFKLSPYQFVNFILDNKDNTLLSSIDSNTFSTLDKLSNIMDIILNGSSLSAKDMSDLLGTSLSDTKLLYSLYNSIYVNKNTKVSLYTFTNFLVSDVLDNSKYSSSISKDNRELLITINGVMKDTLNKTKYNYSSIYKTLSELSDKIDKNLVELVYIYQGSVQNYDDSWTLTIETMVNYLNDDILSDEKFSDFLSEDKVLEIKDAKSSLVEAKDLLVGNNYSRVVINTTYDLENTDTFNFIESINSSLDKDDIYIIGDSPMALDMSKSFNDELNYITILTMIAIFVVVAITFKSIIIPLILVLVIQCAVYITMAYLSLTNASVYFISLLIVQSILMGATIDYAIVYTSYYLESRKSGKDVMNSIINSYNNSIHTILTSSSILVIVTFIVGNFASAIAAQICMTLSKGTLCSALIIIFLLPSILAIFDKLICKKETR